MPDPPYSSVNFFGGNGIDMQERTLYRTKVRKIVLINRKIHLTTSWCVMMKGIPLNYDSTFIEGYYRFCSECDTIIRAVDWDSLLKDYR